MNKLFLSNEVISIAVRDFLKFIIFLGIKLVSTMIIRKLLVKCIIGPFWAYCMTYFPKSFLFCQQGNKSLTQNVTQQLITYTQTDRRADK